MNHFVMLTLGFLIVNTCCSPWLFLNFCFFTVNFTMYNICFSNTQSERLE